MSENPFSDFDPCTYLILLHRHGLIIQQDELLVMVCSQTVLCINQQSLKWAIQVPNQVYLKHRNSFVLIGFPYLLAFSASRPLLKWHAKGLDHIRAGGLVITHLMPFNPVYWSKLGSNDSLFFYFIFFSRQHKAQVA